MICDDEALRESINPFCTRRDGEGKTTDVVGICETADVLTAQTQTHLLANHLWAHAFWSLQKCYLDQA